MSDQTPEFWNQVEAAFSAVLDAGEAARTAALETYCGGRSALRIEVETLLEAHARAGEFIAPGKGPLAPPEEQDADLHTQVGAFRLLERIAEGGMGAVYRAERVTSDFTQKVAVKLIASTMYGADTLRRFRVERQILASLQHPNIVSLLDGGVTPEGRPYIAMEFVEGVPITHYCRQHTLTLEARLRLFQKLCQAVSFAHRHLVVHRDLKPANVLVTTDGTVKVLDFGVAKLLEPEARSAQATGMLFGPLTPDYASPEQIRGERITTACDVYALGVMLFELLSGRRPYDTAGKRIDQMMQLVLHATPTRPSAAPAGGVPYPPGALRGDLDAIVLRATDKDPERRYASVEDLAEEIQRHLDGRPVIARPPSIRYLAGKAIARHRRLFAVASVLLVLLLTALGGALWQARIAARQRERAERQARETRALANTLLFQIHDLISALPGATKARESLVATALQYLERLSAERGADRGLAREVAAAYERIADIQGNFIGTGSLGQESAARESLLKALAIREELRRADPENANDRVARAVVQNHLARTAKNAYQWAEARRWAEGSLRELEPVARGGEREALDAQSVAYQHLASACYGLDLDCGAGAELSALSLRRQLVAQHPDDVQLLAPLASLLRTHGTRLADGEPDPGQLQEAEANLRESITLQEQLVARDPGNFPWAQDLELGHWFLGSVLVKRGQVEEGVREQRRAVAFMERAVELDPANFNLPMLLIGAQSDLAASLEAAGLWEEAVRVQTAAVRRLEAVAASKPDAAFLSTYLAARRNDLVRIQKAAAAKRRVTS
jgi:non-specific serine/threonine protein kinase/serine/threonine-protein kinase